MCIIARCNRHADHVEILPDGSLTGPKYCRVHAPLRCIKTDAVPVVRCKDRGCTHTPLYGFKVGPPLYCVEHRPKGSINVTDRFCIRCEKNPKFNYPGSATGLTCEEHSVFGMLNVLDSTCYYYGCTNAPTHSNDGVLFCMEHRYGNSREYSHTNTKCINCIKPTNHGSLYCTVHDKYSTSKKCIYPECKRIARFNYKKFPGPIFCARHSLHGMISADRKEQLCRVLECENELTISPFYCQEHLAFTATAFAPALPAAALSAITGTRTYIGIDTSTGIGINAGTSTGINAGTSTDINASTSTSTGTDTTATKSTSAISVASLISIIDNDTIVLHPGFHTMCLLVPIKKYCADILSELTKHKSVKITKDLMYLLVYYRRNIGKTKKDKCCFEGCTTMAVDEFYCSFHAAAARAALE